MNMAGIHAVIPEIALSNRRRIAGPVLDRYLTASRIGIKIELHAQPVQGDDRVRIGKGNPAGAVVQGARSNQRPRGADAARMQGYDLRLVLNRDRRRPVGAGVEHDDNFDRLGVEQRIQRRPSNGVEAIAEQLLLVVNRNHYADHWTSLAKTPPEYLRLAAAGTIRPRLILL